MSAPGSKPDLSEVRERFGVDPSRYAARPWLWNVDSKGTLFVVAASSESFPEPNYLGHDGPMVGGPGWAHHNWRPLRV